MTAVTGRGAQNFLGTAARAAARGASAATLEGNDANMLALVAAGTAGAGTTVDGTTSSGRAPLDPVYAHVDETGSPTFTVENTITAHAGGTQAAAYALTKGMSRITIVATAADSVTLPVMVAGQMAFVINSDAADAVQVFGAGTATINGVATATGVSLAATKVGIYIALTAGLIYGGALA